MFAYEARKITQNAILARETKASKEAKDQLERIFEYIKAAASSCKSSFDMHCILPDVVVELKGLGFIVSVRYMKENENTCTISW